MSKVYSFRLDENNPREAQAREVIDAWASKGYSLRHILVEALIQYNNKSLDDLDILLNELRRLIERSMGDWKSTNVEKYTLPNLFTEAVKQSVKSGIRVE